MFISGHGTRFGLYRGIMSRGLSLSRATKSNFHREKDEHTGDGDRACLVSSGQHEQDVQNEFSKGSEHCPFSRTIVAKKLPCPLVHKLRISNVINCIV